MKEPTGELLLHIERSPAERAAQDTSCDVCRITLAADDGDPSRGESGSMTKPLLPRLAAAGLLVAVALTASGCGVVDALVYKQKSAEYTDAAAFENDGDLDVPWLPADSTGIRVTQSTQADDAVIAVHSDESLDDAVCAEVPRQSAPAYVLEDTVDAYTVSAVFACGTWTVAETPDGWLGWTPNHPDEAEQSPAS